MFSTISDLRQGLSNKSKHSPEYIAKMLHAIPDAETVDRPKYIIEKVTGKRVLEFGASGPMHEAIVKAATLCEGVDREDSLGILGFDLDDVTQPLSHFISEPFDIIVCGEVLEHLANPGFFLQRLKKQYPNVPVLITVPNAFSTAGKASLKEGTEMVNRDHTQWYSWKTLTTLLERYGYVTKEFYWYNGPEYFAEGMVFLCV
jgi:hypothetical protein